MNKLKIHSNRQIGFTLLEMIVTMAITAILITAVFSLLEQTKYYIDFIDDEMTQRSTLNDSMDRLMEDMVTGVGDQFQLDIQQNLTWETSEVVLKRDGRDVGVTYGDSLSQVNWIGVPRDFEQDLGLFRKEIQPGSETTPVYVSQCDNLQSFIVDQLDPNGDPIKDPNMSSTVIDIHSQIYRKGNRQDGRTITVRRTFSLHRY